MRFVAEFEVEVVDPTTAAEFTFDFGHDADGEVVMMPYPDQESQMRAAVGMALTQGLIAFGPRAGFKWLSGGGPFARAVDEHGYHPEMTVPMMPARRNDGTYPDQPPPTAQ